jgi:hypothetical protein
MQHYLISIYQPDGDPPPPEVLGPIMEGIGEWNGRLRAADAWVFTAGLLPPSTATVVRVGGSEEVITDGPFTEGKEHLGGFTVISAADLDVALDWARQLAGITTLPIEVRPMAQADGQG